MFFLHVGGKIKKKLNCLFFFSSGIIFSHRRASSTKQYTACHLKMIICPFMHVYYIPPPQIHVKLLLLMGNFKFFKDPRSLH